MTEKWYPKFHNCFNAEERIYVIAVAEHIEKKYIDHQKHLVKWKNNNSMWMHQVKQHYFHMLYR